MITSVKIAQARVPVPPKPNILAAEASYRFLTRNDDDIFRA